MNSEIYSQDIVILVPSDDSSSIQTSSTKPLVMGVASLNLER